MCVAVPARITKIDGFMADVELGGIKRRVSVMLTPEAKIGDYVVLHAGYAISVMDEQEADATFKLFAEVLGTDADG
jgi:hydrogenase expression/formation protein HypC